MQDFMKELKIVRMWSTSLELLLLLFVGRWLRRVWTGVQLAGLSCNLECMTDQDQRVSVTEFLPGRIAPPDCGKPSAEVGPADWTSDFAAAQYGPNTHDQLVLVTVFEMEAMEEQVERLGAGREDPPSTSLQERREDSTSAVSESPREEGRPNGSEDAGKVERNSPEASANEGQRPRVVSDDEVPPDMKCPITMEIMSEPVMLVETGLSFEKAALMRWFRRWEIRHGFEMGTIDISGCGSNKLRPLIRSPRTKNDQQVQRCDQTSYSQTQTKNDSQLERYLAIEMYRIEADTADCRGSIRALVR